MDELYVKMSKKAEEIQARWSPRVGDRCVSPQNAIEIVTKSKWQVEEWDGFPDRTEPAYLTTTIGKGGSSDWLGYNSIKDFVWLPYQDQLQEMVLSNYRDAWDLVEVFGSRVFYLSMPYLNPSMSQLWLAFCMAEMFNKVWDGETWIVRE